MLKDSGYMGVWISMLVWRARVTTSVSIYGECWLLCIFMLAWTVQKVRMRGAALRQ